MRTSRLLACTEVGESKVADQPGLHSEITSKYKTKPTCAQQQSEKRMRKAGAGVGPSTKPQ